jgi:hypothetical protein
MAQIFTNFDTHLVKISFAEKVRAIRGFLGAKKVTTITFDSIFIIQIIKY